MATTESQPWAKDGSSFTFMGEDVGQKNAPPKNLYPFGMKQAQKSSNALLSSKFEARATLMPSETGIFHAKEKAHDLTEEQEKGRAKHPDVQKLESRSLFDQLNHRKQVELEQRETEVKESRLPAALDDEEKQFYDALEEKKREKEKILEEEKDTDVASYKIAMASRTQKVEERKHSIGKIAPRISKGKQKSVSELVKRRIKVKKRKLPTEIGSEQKNKNSKTMFEKCITPEPLMKTSPNVVKGVKKNNIGNKKVVKSATTLGLTNYSSDSSDSSDDSSNE